MEIPFEKLDAAHRSGGVPTLLRELTTTLEASGNTPLLLETRLLEKRHELGLPLLGELDHASLSAETKAEIERHYRETCRELGQRLLDGGDFIGACPFLRAAGDTAPIAAALEEWRRNPPDDIEAELDPVLELAIGQGVAPITGFELLLEHRGTCDAISILESQFPYGNDVKTPCVSALVRSFYRELRDGLDQDLVQHEGQAFSDGTVLDVLDGRRWLFRGNRCHVDDSHLQAVIRFSVLLDDPDDLARAAELAIYGMHLPSGFQHSELCPFEDFYNDYRILLDTLAGRRVTEGIDHFQEKLDRNVEQHGRALQFPAEVLVFLLARTGQLERAIETFEEHLIKASRLTLSPTLFDLCRQLGDYGGLRRAARENQNPLQYAVGLIYQGS